MPPKEPRPHQKASHARQPGCHAIRKYLWRLIKISSGKEEGEEKRDANVEMVDAPAEATECTVNERDNDASNDVNLGTSVPLEIDLKDQLIIVEARELYKMVPTKAAPSATFAPVDPITTCGPKQLKKRTVSPATTLWRLACHSPHVSPNTDGTRRYIVLLTFVLTEFGYRHNRQLGRI